MVEYVKVLKENSMPQNTPRNFWCCCLARGGHGESCVQMSNDQFFGSVRDKCPISNVYIKGVNCDEKNV